MLNFRTAYLQAMRDQAPAMFKELRKTGAMEAHLDRKAEEARAMYASLVGDKPTMQEEREATEQVYATLITFPPPDSVPDEPEQPPTP